jgi:acetyltransferase-like isoleucine patch superfamily enzyme
MIKKYIIGSKHIRSVLGQLSYLWLWLSFRLRGGSKNQITIHPTVLFRGKSKINIKGGGNTLRIDAFCRLRSVNISIHGKGNTIHIEDGVKFYDSGRLYVVGDNATIKIGSESTVGSADIFCGEGNTSIDIGTDCMLSRNIRINTSDFHSIIDLHSGKRINPPQDIKLGDHVWVGNGVTIIKGSKVGDHSIIASQAVLTNKTYPPNSVLAGLPAKLIKQKVSWSREKLPY